MKNAPGFQLNVATVAFWAFHFSLFGIFLIPFRTIDFWILVGSYSVRMFFITAGYHRYFSHRTFSTSRLFQFFLAFMAQTSSQKGVVWWTAHHRSHHRYADQQGDAHSPNQGFLWSHCGWFLSREHEQCDESLVRDLTQFSELVWISKYWAIPVAVFTLAVASIGGWGGVYWGVLVGTVLLWHGTFTINSLSHVFGTRRYSTPDLSKNNPLLAVITLGEGWHNNHHRFPGASRNGFYWWELDVTYYVLKFLSGVGLIWKLRPVPAQAYKVQMIQKLEIL